MDTTVLCTSCSRSKIDTRLQLKLPLERGERLVHYLSLSFAHLLERSNSLFQIVVDNDETATIILDRMVQDKSGRVTFMPLNRLDVKDYQYPQTNEAIPM